MHINDAVFLEDLCPKFRFRQWRKSIHKFTEKSCIYCGKPSESIDHVIPRSQGGLSKTENCVPACLSYFIFDIFNIPRIPTRIRKDM